MQHDSVALLREHDVMPAPATPAAAMVRDAVRPDERRMPKVLGLSFFFHDSAAALVVDGRVVAALAEERLSRRKHTNEFPKHAIEYCLEAGGVSSINELDAVVFYEKPLLKLDRLLETFAAVWPRGLRAFTTGLPRYLTAKFNVYNVIQRTLPGYHGRILFADHHLSHAASAFYCSPYEEAAILTIDGVGEWETTTIGVGRGRQIRLERAIHFPHSVGLLYSALTSYLGFHVNDGEWKVMGLAPYGEPKYADQFRRLVRINSDGSFALEMKYFAHHYSSRWTAHNRRWEALFGFPRRQPGAPLEQRHEDLARSGQMVVEDIILNLAREARRASGCENLVIAGGVGLNSVANWRIERENIFRNVWIQPAAGDDGGAAGAALLVSQTLFDVPRTPEMTDAYLGPGYSDEEVAEVLDAAGVPFERYADDVLVERVADLIAAGKVIGWCRGRMEFGPRALGSRSILADATNPDMKAIINQKIKYREYFRPFAPAVPLEDVHRFFEVPPGTSLPFMLKVPPVRAEARSLIPAVTHEDGTGRVQTVTEDSNPLYYRLLRAVERRTGVPVVVNTSFNIRGEPIVCTPQDALACFFSTGIDALVLNNCLVTGKAGRGLDISSGYARSDRLEAQLAAEEPVSAAVAPAAGTTPPRPIRVSAASSHGVSAETTREVLDFYKQLPFNFYSNAVDTAKELMRSNRIKSYPPLHAFLTAADSPTVIDVGCGAGWFVNSCAYFYGARVTGVDLNPVALRQARSVGRLIPGSEKVRLVQANVFDFEPETQFSVVNSLGVLHHTPDCHAAIRRVLQWVEPGGFLHLGLYHLFGRRPFLEHFARMTRAGASEETLYTEFTRLNPDISDETHLRSWFRDQVLHPHETQHTFEEVDDLLQQEGFEVQATSLNAFRSLPARDRIRELEARCERASERALRNQGRYYPGFFVVWARRR